MNKRLLNIIVLLSVVMTTTSCKKWLTLQPQDGIIRQEFWKTKEDVQSAVIGCYASLLGDPAGKDKPLSEYLFLWGELRADMIAPTLKATADEVNVVNVNMQSTNTVTNWAAVYRTINYCNTVIDYAPGVLATDNTFTQTQLNAYLSEVKALRALMYFYLVRSFRDVPLKLKSTSSDEDLQQLPKTSGDSVLTQIVADLNYADSNVAISYGSSYYDKGRITKYTVKAIEADVYLWMDNYQKCLDACNFIINSNQFGLIAGDGGWFTTLFYQGNSNESIFEFQFDAQKLNSFYGMFTTSTSRFAASGTVMDNIYGIDYVNGFKDIRGDGAALRATDGTIWKYLGVNSSNMRTSDASYAHWFVYRYADILLMKAEALNQMGNGPDALTLVYQLRTRASALSVTDANPSPTDKNSVADFILAERSREFAYEGKRWYDLLRNAKRDNYARIDLLFSVVAGTVAANMQQSAINKYNNHNSHYFPIYYYEIQNDPNLVQNPFYQ